MSAARGGWQRVVGQEQAVATLQEAAAAARRIVAGQADPDEIRAMTHAWLLTGPPGSGRSVAARAFAAALQCTGEEIGCGQCPACRTVWAGNHADVMNVATEKVTISIDEVRSLVALTQQAPSQGRWRVILVEDADRMAERSANVLLKSVEEPPDRTVWLLCAPSPEDVITTIRSRCRGLSLRIPAAEAVAELLVTRDGADPEVALAAARAAQSHIGLAAHLAKDPEARERRRRIISAPARVTSVGEAVFAAQELVEIAQEEARIATQDRDAAEKSALLRTLGAEEGARLPPHVRSQFKTLEEEQKRRATRAQRDVLDRAMTDLLALYRDVLVHQTGDGVEPINTDLDDLVTKLASQSDLTRTIHRIEAVTQARSRLAANVAPLLAVEAMVVELRPQARLHSFA